MAANLRHSYPLIELARVRNGRITQIHHNACPMLDGGPCVCGEPCYRLVRAPKARRGR
jgi:hypothetical protein